MHLPETETLLLEKSGPFLHVTLNRPKARNAMSLQMVHEFMEVFDAIRDQQEIRALVLRGTDGHFCAGGDIKDMANARAAMSQSDSDPFYALNREFGHMLVAAEALPQVVVAVIEGAVLGGGFGLACISDVAIAKADAKFGLPETGLGLPPAQIAPFVVKRIGLTQARRIALLGSRFDASEARTLGIIHEVAADEASLDARLAEILQDIRRCAPGANRTTKQLMLDVGREPLESLLDRAAQSFSGAVQGPEGQEGTMAFVQKRQPAWATE